MTTNNTSPITPFIPDSKSFSTESPEKLKNDLTLTYQDIAAGINNRTVGIHTTQSTITGQKLYGLDNQVYMVYRVMVSIDSILNGTTTVPHGIEDRENIRYLSIKGAGTLSASGSPPGGGIPLPYVNVTTPGNGVELDVVGANIVLTTTTGSYTNYSALVVIEYARPGPLSPQGS